MTESENVQPDQESCEKHGVPMEYQLVMKSQTVTDAEGNEKETGDFYEWICEECEGEKLINIFMSVGEGSSEGQAIIAQYKESVKKKNVTNAHPMLTQEPDLICRYAPILSDITSVSTSICEWMIKFDISLALDNMMYSNHKGPVRGNIGCLWIAPSGSDKTQLYNVGYDELMQEKIVPDSLWDYVPFNRIGDRALIKELSDISKKENKPRQSMTITQDEMAELFRDTKTKGLENTMTTYNMAYDGKMKSSGTILRKMERPLPVYASFWFQGTPDTIALFRESDWKNGSLSRHFFLPYVKSKVLPIEKGEGVIKSFHEDFFEELSFIHNGVRTAEFTDDAWDIYNRFHMAATLYVQRFQTDLRNANKIEYTPLLAMTKFRGQTIKLAQIHAASRFNFDKYTRELTIEKQDVLKAIRDVVSSYRNFRIIFDEWNWLRTQSEKEETIQRLEDRVINAIQTLKKQHKAFEIPHKETVIYKGEKVIDPQTKEPLQRDFSSPNPKGECVAHSTLVSFLHFRKKNFDEVMESMEDMRKIVRYKDVTLVSGKQRQTTKYLYRIKR